MNSIKTHDAKRQLTPSSKYESSLGASPALHGWPKLLRLHFATLAVLSLVGCAQVSQPGGSAGQQTAAKERELLQQVDYAGSSGANRDVSIVILRSLLPGDEGYFPKTKEWAEYVFELKTYGSPVAVQSAAIVTKEGAPLPLARSGLELLEPPKVAQEIAKSNAVYAGAATGGFLLGTAIPFIGPLLMAGAYVYNMSSVMSEEDKLDYDKAFREKAGLNLSHVESNARIVRSVYFPMVPEARSIVVEYKRGIGFAESGRIEIPLRRNGSLPAKVSAIAPDGATASGGLVAVHTAGTYVEPATATTSQQLSIREAQEILHRKGYALGVADGVSGKRTIDALRRFQSNVGLSPSGKLDAATVSALKEL